MHLDGPFGGAETSPGEHAQTQRDGGAVQRQERVLGYTQDLCRNYR
jgi:hypothetical protein